MTTELGVAAMVALVKANREVAFWSALIARTEDCGDGDA